jgi:hypothetical protein
MEEFTCAICNETFKEGDEYFEDSQHSDFKPEVICYGCLEEDLTYPSTVVAIHSEDINKFVFGEYVAFGDYEYGVPDWFKEFIPADWTGRTYVQSDGWRGYYDTFKTLENVTEIAEGWFTGWIDETVTRKQTIADLLGRLEQRDLIPPVPIYVLLEPTSNVFSTATTIFTATKDIDTIKEWLDGEGFTIDNLKFALS